jgi:hypothetical protein
MTYASGGLIQAADYNTFATNINTIWSTGSGNSGYGQTAVASVNIADTVTATQWTTLVNAVNNARLHQSGSNAGLTTYTAGTTISASQAIGTAITTATTNKNTRYTTGTTTTGTVFSQTVNQANTASAITTSVTRTVTFASADQARYFWNCGGQINFVVPTNWVNNNGSVRGKAIGDLLNTVGTKSTRAADNDLSTGTKTGYTVNTDLTSSGWYNQTSSYQTITQITGSTDGSAYASETCYLQIAQLTSTQFGLYFYWSSPAQSPAIDDSINLTWYHRVDIIYPETTYLTNSWGTATVA